MMLPPLNTFPLRGSVTFIAADAYFMARNTLAAIWTSVINFNSLATNARQGIDTHDIRKRFCGRVFQCIYGCDTSLSKYYLCGNKSANMNTKGAAYVLRSRRIHPVSLLPAKPVCTHMRLQPHLLHLLG